MNNTVLETRTNIICNHFVLQLSKVNIEKHFNKKLNFFKLDYLLNNVANITKKCNIYKNKNL